MVEVTRWIADLLFASASFFCFDLGSDRFLGDLLLLGVFIGFVSDRDFGQVLCLVFHGEAFTCRDAFVAPFAKLPQGHLVG